MYVSENILFSLKMNACFGGIWSNCALQAIVELILDIDLRLGKYFHCLIFIRTVNSASIFKFAINRGISEILSNLKLRRI